MKTPTSFSFNIHRGQTILYTTSTPKRAKYVNVQGKLVKLNDTAVKQWFTRSLHPLVGSKAAKEFERLMKVHKGSFKQFWVEALRFQKELNDKTIPKST